MNDVNTLMPFNILSCFLAMCRPSQSDCMDARMRGTDLCWVSANGRWTGTLVSDPLDLTRPLHQSDQTQLLSVRVGVCFQWRRQTPPHLTLSLIARIGTAQSIAGVIVIGFSVDYCVHLAHMFTEARDSLCLHNISFCASHDVWFLLLLLTSSAFFYFPLYVSQAQSRTARGRSQHALSTMGGTVLGGAITTFGSGVFLFPCQIIFFTTMAWLISMTITVGRVEGWMDGVQRWTCVCFDLWMW